MIGFVYVLFNDAMPGILKIGQTSKDPFERMKQLSASTSCPQPFKMLAYFKCEKFKDIEAFAHKNLESKRINHLREFFQVDRCDALEAISHAFDNLEIEKIDSYTPFPLKLEDI